MFHINRINQVSTLYSVLRTLYNIDTIGVSHNTGSDSYFIIPTMYDVHLSMYNSRIPSPLLYKKKKKEGSHTIRYEP